MPDRTTLVIVAVPKQDDHVWDISSEKVPHMTLLFLGDVDWSEAEISRTAGFVEHASSMFTRFGMAVDKRGTLGEDKADVLFFEKGWSFKRVDAFRNSLLADNNIKAAWQAAPQFEEWTPHLTLGFPETPAHQETRDWPISWVEFDRVALWTGDSDGPTFELPTEQDMEVAMSDGSRGAELIEGILSHHGVKGMKWGVRRAAKKAARADKKWQKNIYSMKGAIEVHNATAEYFNSRIGGINDRHPKAHLTDSPNSKETKAYVAAVDSLSKTAASKAVEKVHGTSPSGSLRARLDTSNPAQLKIVVDNVDIKHADQVTPSYTFEIDASNGKIVSLRFVRDELAQSALVEDILEHHGVKGMKWGVRKGKGTPTARTKFSKAPKKLDSEELAKRIGRMEAEKKYNSLNQKDKSKGRQITEEILTDSGKRIAKTVATGAGLALVRTLIAAKFGEGPASEVTRRLK